MDFKELTCRIQDRCPEVARSAWRPIQAKTESEDKFATRFGGNRPFRSSNFRWPICEECHAHKAFLCQINLEKVPTTIQEQIQRNSGLFQLFYCLECTPLDYFKDMDFVPKTEFVPSLKALAADALVKIDCRIKDLPEIVKSYVADLTEDVPEAEYDGDIFEEKEVAMWEELKWKEVPNFEEMACHNNGTLAKKIGITSEDDDIYIDDIDYDVNTILTPQGGIKLGGYIRWCQQIEYPTCPKCKLKMDVTFLQLEDDDLYNFSWGDCGTAHITLCPSCGKAGMSWACA
eukprot:TRINITY_DN33331_c0_g1_i1.p1 TRINITY_DN33331_c0_g1~~TRINITY_DN33331_c0_g1_i1.p1  ORF type:complete len:288 (-),score=73.73 TRINITY_DN33331_c0_g1_i1:493-1356(-)